MHITLGNHTAVIVGSLLATAALPSFAQTVEDVVRLQEESIAHSVETQQRINELDDETREMLNKYRNVTSQAADLDAYNEQLNRMVATQRVELADYERQFQELEVTKRRMLPLIGRMIEVLAKFVAIDTPFLPQERALRIEALRALMDRPDVPTSEKYRRVAEAYQIELEYGHSIEAYEGEIEDDSGGRKTVAFLRFGRLALYYMTLDGLEAGQWDNKNDRWAPLSREFRQPLDRAIRIARKQLPPDLIRLPVPAPETSS